MEQAHYQHSPLLGGLEVLNASFEKQNFSKHSHEGYTIGRIQQGAQEFWRSGANHIAPSGSIILVNADQVHDGHAASDHGWAYDAIYPKPEQFQLLSRELNISSAPYFTEAVLTDPRLSNQLAVLFELLRDGREQLLQETVLYGTLVTLSCHFSQRHHQVDTQSQHQQGLARARELLDDLPEQEFSLTRLASVAGLSSYHFIRQFKRFTGLPPHGYQIQRRLQKAKALIDNGSPLAEAAILAGFHDQSHFHRHFKRALGITPKTYQRAILSKPG